MNTVKLIGNVGREIIVRDFENGKVANFSLATNETYLNRQKEEVSQTTWHKVVAWGKLAAQCEELLAKGKFLTVEGRLQYREYLNRENQKVQITEIVASRITETAKKPTH